MTTEHERHERRTLAMVATEAALAREQNPARYARLEQRNQLLGASSWRQLSTASRSMPEPRQVCLFDALLSDRCWINDVEEGLWTPAADFSNCLAAPRPHRVRLWVETRAVGQGAWQAHHMLLLPRNGQGLVVFAPKPFSTQCMLQAYGGMAALSGGAAPALIEGRSIMLPDGASYSLLIEPNCSVIAGDARPLASLTEIEEGR